MSELPDKTLGAACGFHVQGWRGAEVAMRARITAALEAAMAEELGPDRLVVAGQHEQEIIAKVIRWLRKEGASELAVGLFDEFGPPSEYEGIEDDYR